jgi:hypothetical protein
MSKKSLQRLAFWLSLLTAISMILSACGGQPTETPVPTIDVSSLGTVTTTCEDITWYSDGTCSEDTGIVGLIIGENERYAVINANMKVTPYEKYADVTLQIDGEETTGNGAYVGDLTCNKADGESISSTGGSSMPRVTSPEPNYFTCSFEDGEQIVGSYTIEVQSGMFQQFMGTTTIEPNAVVVTNAVTQSGTNTPLGTNTPTVTPTAGTFTVTSTLALPAYVTGTPDTFGVITEGTRTIGVDSDNPQVSIMFWEFGKAGTLYSSSASKVLVALDDDPTTPLTKLEPVASYNKCWFFNKQLFNEKFEPCYRYAIAANTVSISAPGMYSEDLYYHGSVEGGPEVYAPKTPTVTPSVTPPATFTATALPTQDMTLGTPVSADAQMVCDGNGQSATYFLSVNPDAVTCIAGLTNQPVESVQFTVGTKHYIVTLAINTEKLYAVYILGGDITTSSASCILNGVTFESGKTNNVKITKGNYNTRLTCKFNGMNVTVIASTQ